MLLQPIEYGLQQMAAGILTSLGVQVPTVARRSILDPAPELTEQTTPILPLSEIIALKPSWAKSYDTSTGNEETTPPRHLLQSFLQNGGDAWKDDIGQKISVLPDPDMTWHSVDSDGIPVGVVEAPQPSAALGAQAWLSKTPPYKWALAPIPWYANGTAWESWFLELVRQSKEAAPEHVREEISVALTRAFRLKLAPREQWHVDEHLRVFDKGLSAALVPLVKTVELLKTRLEHLAAYIHGQARTIAQAPLYGCPLLQEGSILPSRLGQRKAQ